MIHTTLPVLYNTAKRKELETRSIRSRRKNQKDDENSRNISIYFRDQEQPLEEGLSTDEDLEEYSNQSDSEDVSSDLSSLGDETVTNEDLNDNSLLDNGNNLLSGDSNIENNFASREDSNKIHIKINHNDSEFSNISSSPTSLIKNSKFNKNSKHQNYLEKQESNDSAPISINKLRRVNSDILSRKQGIEEPSLDPIFERKRPIKPSSGRKSGKSSGRQTGSARSSQKSKELAQKQEIPLQKTQDEKKNVHLVEKSSLKENPQWKFIKSSLVSGYRKIDKLLSVDPDSTKKRVWNIIALIFVTLNCIMIPLRIGWGQHQLYWIPVDLLIDLVTIIDIILFSMSMYIRDGAKVHEFRLTAKKYITSKYFLIDLISILPIDIIGWFVGYYSFFRLNRLIRLIREKYYFETIEELFPNINPTIIRLLRSILFTLTAAHFTACCFFFIMSTQGATNMSVDFIPAKVFYLLDLNFFQQYIRSFYWAIVSMTGYSNTQPQSNYEVLFSLCVSSIGLSLYITIVGTVGSLITNIDASKQYFISRLDEINAFMNFRQLPSEIQDQVREYYTYLWKSRRSLNESKVFADLPIHLQIEVAMKLNEKFIMKVDIFQGAEQQFIERIVLQMRPKLALPGVFVVRQGEIGREMYLISKGEVEVVLGNGLIVATLPAGKIFGEIALLENCRRNASIRAKTYCDLFILSKKDFTEALEAFPDQKARVAELARKKIEETAARNKDKADK